MDMPICPACKADTVGVIVIVNADWITDTLSNNAVITLPLTDISAMPTSIATGMLNVPPLPAATQFTPSDDVKYEKVPPPAPPSTKAAAPPCS